MLDKGNWAVLGVIMVIGEVFVNGLGSTSTIFFGWNWWGWGECGGSRESMKLRSMQSGEENKVIDVFNSSFKLFIILFSVFNTSCRNIFNT